jgi:hypothetical protein
MGLAPTPAAGARLTPEIPEAGLTEALEGWSSKGELWRALAAVPADREWTWRDSERRAMRVLLAELHERIATWPALELDWAEALPAVSEHRRETGTALGPGVIWPATRLRGWPPSEFVSRPRNRVADQLLITALRWTADRLVAVRRDAVAAAPDCDLGIRRQLDVVERLLELEPIASAEAIRPAAQDLRAIASEGRPWAQMVAVTRDLLSLDEHRVLALARRLVAPTEERWRLFHLAVLGQVLLDLRRLGCTYRSLRPLSASTSGPAFEVLDGRGRRWELWFEAAGMWDHQGVCDPYATAAAGVAGAGTSLGCDVALVRVPHCGLLLDAKYSPHASVVARDGYRAALAYAADARSGLIDSVLSAAVGPSDVVRRPGWAETAVGFVGVVAPHHLRGLLADLLASDDLVPRPRATPRGDANA